MTPDILPAVAEPITPVPGGNGPLPADDFAAAIAWVKDVIAGRVPPPLIAIPPDIPEFYRTHFADKVPPPNPKVLARFAERRAIERAYRGLPVLAYMRSDDGLSVLTAGEDEVFAMLDALTPAEQSKVLVLAVEDWF